MKVSETLKKSYLLFTQLRLLSTLSIFQDTKGLLFNSHLSTQLKWIVILFVIYNWLLLDTPRREQISSLHGKILHWQSILENTSKRDLLHFLLLKCYFFSNFLHLLSWLFHYYHRNLANSIKVGVYHPPAKDNQRERKALNYKCDMTKTCSLKAVWSFQFSNSLHDILWKALLNDQAPFYVESFSRNFLYPIKSEMSKVLIIFLITLHTHHRSWKAQDSAALPSLCPLRSFYFLWSSNNPQKFIRTFWWSTIAFKQSITK